MIMTFIQKSLSWTCWYTCKVCCEVGGVEVTSLQRGQPQRSAKSKSVGLALKVSIHSGRENKEEESTDQNSIMLTSVDQFQGTNVLSRVCDTPFQLHIDISVFSFKTKKRNALH